MAKKQSKPATKEDIQKLAQATREDIQKLARSTKEDIQELVQSTKEDIQELARMVARAFEKVATKEELKHYATKEDLANMKQEIIEEVTENARKLQKETHFYFDAAVENIHVDLAGANKDEISLIQDKHANHEKRITKLEDRVGVVPVI